MAVSCPVTWDFLVIRKKPCNPPVVYSISREEENKKFKNCCQSTSQQRLKAFLIPLHFWSRNHNESRDSILAKNYTTAGLAFVFYRYEEDKYSYGITGNQPTILHNDYKHILHYLQSS